MGRKTEQSELDAQLLPSQEFTSDLRHLYGVRPVVPGAVDEQIAAMARERLASPNLVRLRRQRLIRRLVAASSVGAAAAVLALVVWSGVLAPSPLKQVEQEPGSARVALGDPRDIDANGRVDILDAFSLARRIETANAGSGGDVDGDIDGDGVVGRRDVDAVAMAAVRLDRGGASRRAENGGAL